MRNLALQTFRNISPEIRKTEFAGFVYSDDGLTVTVFEHGEEADYAEATAAFLARMREREEEPTAPVTDEIVDPIESDPLVSVLISEAEQSVACEQTIFRDETEILRTERGQFYVAKDMRDWMENYNGATPTAGELVDAIKYLLEFLKN